MPTRLHIDQLVLRTRGLTPAAAEAAARAIPPALAGQLNASSHPRGPIPALTVTAAATHSPTEIARAIAAQLARQSSG